MKSPHGKDVILGALRQILPQDKPMQALEIASGIKICC
jgi:hypothetical protein